MEVKTQIGVFHIATPYNVVLSRGYWGLFPWG